MIIAGVGSRSTPPHILAEMTLIGEWCRAYGILVRSGHAAGADYAFEVGAQDLAEVFLPWKGFNSHLPPYGRHMTVTCDESKQVLVRQFHPAYRRLSRGGWALMARNCCQVLGESLEDPVSAIVCWTPNAGLNGGTAFALHIAQARSIPVFNMYCKEFSTRDLVMDRLTSFF